MSLSYHLDTKPSNLRLIWKSEDHGHPTQVLQVLRRLDTEYLPLRSVVSVGFRKYSQGTYHYYIQQYQDAYTIFMSFKRAVKRETRPFVEVAASLNIVDTGSVWSNFKKRIFG